MTKNTNTSNPVKPAKEIGNCKMFPKNDELLLSATTILRTTADKFNHDEPDAHSVTAQQTEFCNLASNSLRSAAKHTGKEFQSFG